MVYVGFVEVSLSFADSLNRVVGGMGGLFGESDVARLRAFLEGIDDLKQKHNVDVYFVETEQQFDLGYVDLKINLDIRMSGKAIPQESVVARPVLK